jgi:SAM-dependent methyltransferase
MPSFPASAESHDVDVRVVNAKIGKNYDTLLYDCHPDPELDPQRVLGLAALYGCAGDSGADVDILDLGCGTGTQLERVGALTGGKLVGVDISGEACGRARQRCAKYGDRARIVCADFLDLDPEDLGRFDLIYNIGVIFITPAAIQQSIVSLIARCLKPAGVVALSYYAGGLGRLLAGLYRTLRAALDPSQDRATAIRKARERIDQIAAHLPSTGPLRKFMGELLHHVSSQSDTMLFHEGLNHAFEAMDAASLESMLGGHGVHFLNYLTPTPFGMLPAPYERALAADAFDFAVGSYRHAVFGKPVGSSQAVNLRSPLVRWQTRLVRMQSKINYAEPASFQDSVTKRVVPVTPPTMQAALDALANGPCTWVPMCEGAQGLLAKQGVSLGVDADPQFERDFASHWQIGALTPLWAAPQAAAGAADAASGSRAPVPPPRHWAAAGE